MLRKSLALVALAIAGFALGFAGCGEDEPESPREGTATVMTTDGTTTDGTTTNGTTTDEDDGIY